MPVTNPFVRLTVRYTWLGELCQTARTFNAVGAAFLTADCLGVAEAFWNDVKDTWRDIIPNTSGSVLTSVLCEEYGLGGGLAEYAIPFAESTGDRAVGGLGDYMPAYVAGRVRFTVGTRLTRPGQMRIPFAVEGDNVDGNMGSGYRTFLDALAAKYSSVITLGAPVATGTLTPQVVSGDDISITPVVRQPIVGYVSNIKWGSQVSRRPA